MVAQAREVVAWTRSRLDEAQLAFLANLPASVTEEDRLYVHANAFAPLFGLSEAEVAALQNSTEWWGGLLFTLFFFALAALWRASRFAVRFSTAAVKRW